MPTRRHEGRQPQVTLRFQEDSLCFRMSVGDTVGDLACHLARVWEERGEKPLTIALSFPRVARPVLH